MECFWELGLTNYTKQTTLFTDSGETGSYFMEKVFSGFPSDVFQLEAPSRAESAA